MIERAILSGCVELADPFRYLQKSQDSCTGYRESMQHGSFIAETARKPTRSQGVQETWRESCTEGLLTPVESDCLGQGV